MYLLIDQKVCNGIWRGILRLQLNTSQEERDRERARTRERERERVTWRRHTVPRERKSWVLKCAMESRKGGRESGLSTQAMLRVINTWDLINI